MNENTKAIAETIYQELKKHKVAMTEYYAEQVATALDAAGYRKQSDTVKEFIKDVKNIYAGRNDKEKHTMIAFLFTQLDKLAEQYGKEEK